MKDINMDIEQIKSYKSIRFLSAEFKEACVADLEDIIETFKKLITKKEEQEQLERQANADKIEAAKKAYDLIRTFSLTQEDIARYGNEKDGQRQRKSPGKAKPKYSFEFLDGITRTWSGRGRMPVPFAQLLESNGKAKEDYLIPEDSVQYAE